MLLEKFQPRCRVRGKNESSSVSSLSLSFVFLLPLFVWKVLLANRVAVTRQTRFFFLSVGLASSFLCISAFSSAFEFIFLFLLAIRRRSFAESSRRAGFFLSCVAVTFCHGICVFSQVCTREKLVYIQVFVSRGRAFFFCPFFFSKKSSGKKLQKDRLLLTLSCKKYSIRRK